MEEFEKIAELKERCTCTERSICHGACVACSAAPKKVKCLLDYCDCGAEFVTEIEKQEQICAECKDDLSREKQELECGELGGFLVISPFLSGFIFGIFFITIAYVIAIYFYGKKHKWWSS